MAICARDRVAVALVAGWVAAGCGDPAGVAAPGEASTGAGPSEDSSTSTSLDPGSTGAADLGSSGALDDTGGSTTGELDPCAACETWTTCVDGICVPEHATCVADERGATTCTCDAGYWPNAGKCVDRILFALPMENRDGGLISDVVGVDNDPMPGDSDLDCVSHDGSPFPSCYDDHDGTDFILEGGFATMDAGSAGVYAAAEGDVVLVHDGEYDRCALDPAAFAVTCEDGGPVTPANRITVAHADGTSTRYLHLKKGSILVAEGDHVACGELMALVGSSGNSSMPHLHFGVDDVDGNATDPFAGPGSQPESRWAEQDGAYGLPGAACQ